MEIDKNKIDAWGILSLNYRAFQENEFAIRKDMSMPQPKCFRCGRGFVRPFMDSDPPGFPFKGHTRARSKTSVLNSWNQCHDIKNLFITDGACMASSSA